MFLRTAGLLIAAFLPLIVFGGQAAQTPATPTDYVLGPGDAITETVVNHPEFSSPFLVPTGGVVVFPVAGAINVDGMTIQQLTDQLTTALKNELLQPRVTITLNSARLQQVFVYGDVQKPGAVPITPGMRLSDAFNSTGGLSQDFKLSEAQITLLPRNGAKEISPLIDVLSGKGDSNPVLHDGDTVNVDAGWFICYVIGQVTNPGAQHMKRGTGLLQAIAAAGGPTDQGLISRVEIKHTDKRIEEVDLVPTLVRGQKVALPELRPGDLITVPLNLDQYSVLGYVKKPGTFPIPQGKTLTLAEAVSSATGQEKDQDSRGMLSHVRLARMENGTPKMYTYDLGKFLVKGDPSQNPDIKPGDVVYVPQSNQVGSTTAVQILSGLGVFWYYGIARH